MLALIAAVPIAVAFLLLTVFRLSAAKAMGVGWSLATIFGLSVWQMGLQWWSASVVYGGLQALEIALIIFGAILLMNYLDRSGAISTIRWHFTQIQEDRRIQLLIIGFGFIVIIEGVAGFGTPAALAAPLMIGLGFPPLAAAVFGLWFNAPNPPFGVAGIPTLQGIGSVIGPVLPPGEGVQGFLSVVSRWTGITSGLTYTFWGLLAVWMMIYWFGSEEERSLKKSIKVALPVAPFALALGLTTGLLHSLVAWFMGPELPDIISGFAALGLGIVMARKGFLIPEDSWDFIDKGKWSDVWRGGLNMEESFQEKPKKEMAVLKSWTPYILVAGFLLVTRLPGLGLADLLARYGGGIGDIFGTDLSFFFKPLYLPGVVPFIPVAIFSGFLYKMERREVLGAWRNSLKRTLAPAITLIVAVSMSQIMIQSKHNPLEQLGMMESLSQALALGAGGALSFVAPWIGALGGFVTGSNTSSNILFSPLQYGAAREVGLNPAVITSLQNVGGGIGNLVSVLNVAAISGVIGVTGREGDMIRKTIVPTVVYGCFAGGFGTLLVYVVAPLFP